MSYLQRCPNVIVIDKSWTSYNAISNVIAQDNELSKMGNTHKHFVVFLLDATIKWHGLNKLPSNLHCATLPTALQVRNKLNTIT